MDLKSKITQHKLFDYLLLGIIGYYTILINPINIVFTVITTRAYLLNNENLLNSFIIELIGFICLAQLYFIKCYNYVVRSKEFKKLYIKTANSFPVLNNYDPEMLFIELLCSDKENSSMIIDNNTENDTSEKVEESSKIPIESDSKKIKKMFMSEILQNPALISNMTKMMGNIDPNVLKSFSNNLGNK